MKLKETSHIHSGHITRRKIDAAVDGSHYLLQAKDVDGKQFTHDTKALVRFNPALSRNDQALKEADLLFMARGARNFTIQVKNLPEPTLAAACFFIIRVSSPEILPGYLCWYLNQASVEQYLLRHSGRSVHMPVVRRVVLENMEIPVPPLALQTQIADMNTLMLNEIRLLQKLSAKRKELVTAACMQAVRDYQKERPQG